MALQTLMHKQTSGLKSLFILYTFSFCCVMFYIVSKIDNGRLFLKDCFYCYSQQIISTVAKKSITLDKEYQQHRTSNAVTPNTTQTKSNKCKIRFSLLEKRFCPTHKNMCKIICRMQWLVIQCIRCPNRFN